MNAPNPFAPTFGSVPPVMAGRDDILDTIYEALVTGTTHPDYTTIFFGVRGAGKTVMLNAAEDVAREQGWLTISEDASRSGLIARIERAAIRHIRTLAGPPKRRVRSVQAFSLGADFGDAPPPDAAESLREALSELGDLLAGEGTGLMITVDELLSADRNEIREFGSVMQHVCRREQRPIAFAGAALPPFEEYIETEDQSAFLHRCSRHDIGQLNHADTRLALSVPIQQQGRTIDDEALEAASLATSGYAFMVQLVGFYSWAAAPPGLSSLAREHVESGIAEANRRVSRLVLAPIWRDFSPIDRRFLRAMAADAGESRLADIAQRLGVDVNYAGVYRRRLIRAGMIVATTRGRVDLAHHAARAWIRDMPLDPRELPSPSFD
ncbi:ATP-binding protein [Candidatus Poriferisodalis sp.]|uniref:ATP-binding protein n=1 Tax=Candidatus Poriferisodalis sp. TaxID=3101277 RepID=UPI003C70192F